MPKIIALLAALTITTACTDEPAEIGKIVVEYCGEPPLAPGWAAQFDTVDGQELAILTRASYLEIVQWREDVATWRDCVVAIP